jgi:hypothetical protein
MKAIACYVAAVLLAILGMVIFPGSFREARRLARLDDEGVSLSGEITRIEEHSERIESDADPALQGTYRPVEDATVRYAG